eukprot:gnl/Hemi2/21150_TR7013_c0_g1_i1.p2 gnl/Hemi2/21150_TR7013_c0_g1~~gnl/Hemi2/21150_TR7013_c0_g1_i1.p2  ORF type:complete len:256 (-),score=98.43 gnl/Hemi2/21150_TR7013_c0_g1_i1:92-832(-)
MALAGKVCIVTGASSGIGEGIAEALFAAGAAVCAAGRRLDRLQALQQRLSPSGERFLSSQCDVTVDSQIKACVDATIAKFGKVDVLVNNAGVMLLSFCDKLKVSEWDSMIDINLKGSLHCVGAVLPHFMAQKSGHVINISSDADSKVFPGSAVYSATKSALTMFSRGLRHEVAQYNVRVTSISPGATASELGSHITDADVVANFAKSGLSTFMTPADIAAGVVYALSQPPTVDIDNITLRPTPQVF